MIGEKIKKLRIQNGMTQKQLADKLFVSPQAVSRWENNEVEPSISIITKLANIFEVTTDEILGLEVKENKPDVEKPKPIVAEKKVEIVPTAQRRTAAMCKQCKKPIYFAGEIVYKNGQPYCKHCANEKGKLPQVKKKSPSGESKKRRIASFIFGTLAALVGLLLTLLLWDSVLVPLNLCALAIIYSLSLFTFVSCCILDNNCVGDVFFEIASWSIRMPGLIVSFDLEGCLWFLGMRALFAVIGVALTLLAVLAGLTIGCVISVFVYPFAIIANFRKLDEF